MRTWYGYDDNGVVRSFETFVHGWAPEVDFNAPGNNPTVQRLVAARAEQGINNWLMVDCGCAPEKRVCACHNNILGGYYVSNGQLASKVASTLLVNGQPVAARSVTPVSDSFTLAVAANVPDGSTVSVFLHIQSEDLQEVPLVVTGGVTPEHTVTNFPIAAALIACGGKLIRSVPARVTRFS